MLSFTFLKRFFKCFLGFYGLSECYRCGPVPDGLNKGSTTHTLYSRLGEKFSCFGVSLYEVKEGHCGRRKMRIYTWSLVHTVNENADMFPRTLPQKVLRKKAPV